MQTPPPTKVGIIGCGNISKAYFGSCKLYPNLDLVACADIDLARAQEAAAANGVKAFSVGDLLGSSDIEIAINLTIPQAHAAIDCQALKAGKHVFSEKPFALTLAEVMPRAEIVVVTTPQAAAQRVAQRSAFAARRLKLSVRGVIENMSWFTGDDGKRYELFGSGGGRQLAHDLGVPLLGQVPLVPALREGGDEGIPIMVSDPDGEAAQVFAHLAATIAGLGPARVYRRELTVR